MTKSQQSKLTLLATLVMFAAAAFLIARNDRKLLEDNTQLSVWRERDAVVFEWRDEVRAPMARLLDDAFRNYAGEAPRIVIDLHSPGGLLDEGGAAIDVIERMKQSHEVDTRVGAGHACYSMCVPIFLAGEKRIAGASARFMFHEPTAYDQFTGEKASQPEFERDFTSRRFFDRYFVNSPMEPAWRDKLAGEWKGKDLFYTARELVNQDSNIVTVLE